MTAATIAISADAAPFTAARQAGLTFTAAALYSALAEIPETPPWETLSTIIGCCRRTIANGIRLLKASNLIRETGRAGKTGRVAQYETIHTGPGVAKLAAAGPAAAARIDAEPQGPAYRKGPVTRGQLAMIDELRNEILKAGIKESRLREMVAAVFDLETGPANAGQASDAIQKLIAISRDRYNHSPRNRNRGNRIEEHEPGRYRPAGPARRKRR